MKKILIISIFIFSFSLSNAQWVTIPDPVFVNWLNANGFDMCMNGNLLDTTCTEVITATWIDCSSSGISDITGIQYFDQLGVLNCTDNTISFIPPLANSVYWLWCETNQINSLPSPLPTSLLELYCQVNQLTSLPPLPAGLTTLGCWNNQLTSLPAFPPALIELTCNNNQIASMPAFPNGIKYVICDHNQLTTLPAIPASMRSFEFHNNHISVFPVLPNELYNLYCDNNLLTTIPPLPDSLLYFACGGNFLTSLPPFPDSLRHFSCEQNQLTSLPPIPKTLTILRAYNNQLTVIPPLPDSLYEFTVNNNPQLSCMPPLLKYGGPSIFFRIYGTGISCLPNVIQHNGFVPGIDTNLICDVFNADSCDVYWNIKGKVVLDADANCITTNDGTNMSNLKMNLFDAGGNMVHQVIENWAGEYSFDTQLGDFSTEVDTSSIPFTVLCPVNNHITSSLTAIDSLDYNVDFRLACKPGFDVGAWNVVSSSFFFPGDSTLINVFAGDLVNSLYNVSCNSSFGGRIKVVINGPVTYLSPGAGALIPIVTADTLFYNISDYSLVNSATDFVFNVLTNTTAILGTAVCFDVTVTPTTGDNDIANNAYSHCFTVVASSDPNEKEVSPVGDQTFPFNDWLTYTIHFQNTGTAAAHNIQILDTLDVNLDESTFQLLSASHHLSVQLSGNKIQFNFANINLPDSTADSEGSKGYVSYRIKPRANLPIGTSIDNSASIYFDFNNPVVTNNTHSSVINGINFISNNSISFSLYPNPTSKNTSVEYNISITGTLTIFNLLGEQQQQIILEKNNTKKNISLSNIPAGIYFCVLRTVDGKTAQQKLIIE